MTAGCRRAPVDARRTPWLCIDRGVGESEVAARAWRGLALAMRALPEVRSAELVRDVSSWLSRMEAKAHPLMDDLEDASPLLEGVRAWFLPVWNSACALVDDRFRVPGRDWSVVPARLGASGPMAAGWPAWPDATERERDPDRELARFAAWPISQALLVDCVAQRGIVQGARAMQARLLERSSLIGVFVLPAKKPVEPSPEFDEIRALSERARKFATRTQRTIDDPAVAALLAEAPPAELPFALEGWLDLAATEMLVVPRLGALARTAQFAEEVHAALSQSSVRARILNAPSSP